VTTTITLAVLDARISRVLYFDTTLGATAMSDFDMDAFDNLDFDAIEATVEKNQAEKDKQATKDIEGMRDGANDCGDSCTI
jgi:cellulose biosynthesis protein BcsQ